MKGALKKLLSAVFVPIFAFGLIACESNSSGDGKSAYLNYGTGINEQGVYNSDRYFYNDSRVQVADPHVIWVPKERDPVYGGYYYMYATSNPITTTTVPSHGLEGVNLTAMICHRSTNLSDWELAGAVNGDSLIVYDGDWMASNVMAPEVIYNEAEELYYMYFCAASKNDVSGTKEYASGESWLDRVYLAIATSKTPNGPFEVLHNVVNYDGKVITRETPPINFSLAYAGLGYDVEAHNWGAIDANPFLDDDGTLYLYFNCHPDSNVNTVAQTRGVWGMRMKDWITPDYSTLSILTSPGAVTVSGTPGDIRYDSVTTSGNYWFRESANNEAPYMYKKDGKYYMTYSPTGYSDRNYSVHQAVSDNPLSGFKKLSNEEGNPILNGGSLPYAGGTGHHCFVAVEDELFIVYAKWGNSAVFGQSWARLYGVERVNWVKNSQGLSVMTANGPSKSLHWVPEANGLENVAKNATFSVNGGKGGEYLNDNIIPSQKIVEDRIFEMEDDVTIKIYFDKPKTVSSIMIYNAYEAEMAFSKVRRIRFKLTEQPSWLTGGYDWLVIDNLKFPSVYDHTAEENSYIIANAPAVAEFNPITVSSIEISISIDDRFMLYDRYGDPTSVIQLAEIVVLGE